MIINFMRKIMKSTYHGRIQEGLYIVDVYSRYNVQLNTSVVKVLE